MIKAVIFDFFGVLVTEGFKKFRDQNFPEDKEKWKRAIVLVNRHDSGEITQQDFIKGIADISCKSYEDVASGINTNLPNTQLIEFIRQELKPKYKIGVLSNSGDDYLSRLLDPADAKIFDDIVLSYRYKMVKPQPEIFEFAAGRLGVKTAECLFIDDSSSHCEGAKRAGMTTLLYKDFSSFKTQSKKILSAVTDN